MISLPAALDDPKLFGPWFKGPSWNPWRAVLKAGFAVPMSREELELFRSVAERDPPRSRVRELWVIAGRRSGKDSIASAIAAWFSSLVPYEGLRPGEAANVLCLAVDRAQAKIVLRYTKSMFDRIELLQGLVQRVRRGGGAFDGCRAQCHCEQLPHRPRPVNRLRNSRRNRVLARREQLQPGRRDVQRPGSRSGDDPRCDACRDQLALPARRPSLPKMAGSLRQTG